MSFGVSRPIHVCETDIADVWRVERLDGSSAALKIYKNDDIKNEAPGFSFLEALKGRGAAGIYKIERSVVLLEWLGGPSLGDRVRSGHDAEALDALLDVAKIIHSEPLSVENLPPLATWFEDLFELQNAQSCPLEAAQSVQTAQKIGQALIDSQHDMRILHGDLHHDNVIEGKRGYCAIDAKGVFGERAYELANSVRNPSGADVLIREPGRILYYCRTIASKFDVDYARFFKWVIAHCALSIAWRCDGALSTDPDLDLLTQMCTLAQQENIVLD